MSVIAIVATLNGIIVQVIMASRVLYGLGKQGSLPAALMRVNATTRTPVNATVLTVAVILALALALPLGHLADLTSRITLLMFAIINLALVRIKLRDRGREPPRTAYVAPLWVPCAGVASCIALLAIDAVVTGW